MTNRFCDTEIWTKDWFLNLNTKQKLLVKFLFDNCDCAGFYQISWNLLKVYFNDVEITIDDFKTIKQVRFIKDDLIFIEDFALFQCKVRSFKELNLKNKAHLGVLRLLKKYNIFDYENASPFEAPLKPLASPFEAPQEKEKEKEKDNNSLNNRVVELDSYNDTLIEKEKEKENKKEKESLNVWRGEYSNVHLKPIQYANLVQYVGKKDVADSLIEELSANIAQKKENAPPYDENFPDMHLAKLKLYWKYRKLGGGKPPNTEDKREMLKNELEKLTEKYRLKELQSG